MGLSSPCFVLVMIVLSNNFKVFTMTTFSKYLVYYDVTISLTFPFVVVFVVAVCIVNVLAVVVYFIVVFCVLWFALMCFESV
jgi:hypothetical protein